MELLLPFYGCKIAPLQDDEMHQTCLFQLLVVDYWNFSWIEFEIRVYFTWPLLRLNSQGESKINDQMIGVSIAKPRQTTCQGA